MSTKSYEKIEVIGPVSIARIAEDDKRMPDLLTDSKIILLMGTTGSGKSSFIECLGNNKSLGISKNQLDGVTQQVTLYEITNIRYIESPTERLFIMDTPGFADRSFPETKTIRMVQRWMENYHCFTDRILYLDRITDTRMGGTKGKLLDLLKEMTGEDTGNRITIVTTMWDQLWKDEQISKANTRFEEMSEIYYKAFVDDGAQVVKFENTHESACDIIDKCLIRTNDTMFSIEHMADDRQKMSQMGFGLALHRNLIERKLALTQQLRRLDDDMSLEETRSCLELLESLSKQREEAVHDFAVVEEELKDFPDENTPEQKPVQKPDDLKDDTLEKPKEPPSETSRVKVFLNRMKKRMKGLIRWRE